MTHICVGNLTTIGSDNGLSPGWCQVIIWTNVGILSIWPLWTNFSEILIKIQAFSLKKIRLKVSSAKWQPFCLGLNVLTILAHDHPYFTGSDYFQFMTLPLILPCSLNKTIITKTGEKPYPTCKKTILLVLFMACHQEMPVWTVVVED